MQKQKSSNSDTLKLNSYKIDSNSLQQSLREMNERKSELETTISQYKASEEAIAQENLRLRDQITMLQRKLGQKVEHSTCENRIKELNEEILKRDEEIEKYKCMYDAQKRNKIELTRFYDDKLDMVKADSKALVENYENRIANLEMEIAMVRSSHLEAGNGSFRKSQSSKNVVPLKQLSNKKSQVQAKSMKSSFSQKESSYVGGVKHDTQLRSPDVKTAANIPPKSPTVKEFRTAHSIKNRAQNKSILESEELFELSIRKLYHQIKEMGIKPKEALVLPQFQKINSNKTLSRSELVAFMKNSPIQQKSQSNAENIAEYIENLVKEVYGEITGRFVTQTIIGKVEEYQDADSNIDSNDLQISGMTPSHHQGYSYGMSSVTNSKNEKMSQNPSKSMPNKKSNPYDSTSRPSIADALFIQSDF